MMSFDRSKDQKFLSNFKIELRIFQHYPQSIDMHNPNNPFRVNLILYREAPFRLSFLQGMKRSHQGDS